MLEALLRVDSNQRPSCDEILQKDFVMNKCEELAIDMSDEPLTTGE